MKAGKVFRCNGIEAYLQNQLEQAAMDRKTREVSGDALREALRRIDPDGTLVPDSREYKAMEKMIRGWLHSYGPQKTFEMVRCSAQHVEAWRKFL